MPAKLHPASLAMSLRDLVVAGYRSRRVQVMAAFVVGVGWGVCTMLPKSGVRDAAVLVLLGFTLLIGQGIRSAERRGREDRAK